MRGGVFFFFFLFGWLVLVGLARVGFCFDFGQSV